MNHTNTHSGDSPYVLSQHAVDELAKVTRAVDQLEIQLCLLCVRLEYSDSPQTHHADTLARQIGDIHQTLEDIQTFGF